MVRAIMIVEMAGAPPTHVREKLSEHIGVLEKIKDVTVHSIKVSLPKEVKDSNGIFTCFAEADFEIPNLARLSETTFDFMPSSIEVIEPARVSIEATDATNLMNNISGRMHRYDEIAKIAQFRIAQLTRQLEEAGQKPKPIIKKKTKKKSVKKKKAVKKKKN